MSTTEVVCDSQSVTAVRQTQHGCGTDTSERCTGAHPDLCMETLVCVQSMSVLNPNLEAPAASAL